MKKIILTATLLLPLTTTAAEPTLRINEIAWMGTVASSNDEWIELYNLSDAEVDLADWKITAADGSPEIVLSGTVAAGGYFLLERSDDDTVLTIAADQIYTGALGNTGEHLTLLDAAGTVIDEIATAESWPAGDNTTKQTMERLDNTLWATSVHPGGTPKETNSQTTPQDGNNEEPPPEAGSSAPPEQSDSDQVIARPTVKRGDVVFTELLANPIGPDQSGEFIELQNISKNVIDISSWQIKTNASQLYTIPSQSLDPNEILTVWRAETNLALNNTKETVTLYSVDEKIIDRLSVGASKQPGISYSRDSDGTWQWAKPSPETNNPVIPKSSYPIAVLYAPSSTTVATIIDFDGSDSVDPLNQGLSFSWDFGDGQTDSRPSPRKLFPHAGKYAISLSVTNGVATSTQKTTLTVYALTIQATSTPAAATSTDAISLPADIPFIFISEVLPNPTGSDTENEFIELFSQHPMPVSLAGWQLDDEEGGSKPFTFIEQTIMPGQYLALFRGVTTLALNNDTDSVRLFAPGGQQIDIITYEETSEGQSLVRGEDFGLYGSETPTPGEINTLDQRPKEPTSTPVVLGAQTDAEAQLIESPKTKDNRYLIASVSGALILGMAAGLKLRK